MSILMAPGGALNSALKALDGGADALYLGLKGHSRGGTKGELGEEEFSRCLKHAGRQGKKIYLAFNIIPPARAIPVLLGIIDSYVFRGIAGVILNEPGFLQQVAQRFPSLSITASIGCAISNLQEARFYRDLGADTLVLGPRVGLKDLAQIKAQLDCRVEVFIYGFQEMFNLGQCWLGGYVKSGVRGSEFGVRQRPGYGVRNSGLGFFPNHESRIPNSGLYSPKRSGVCGQVCGLVVGAGFKPAPTLAPQAFYVLHSLKDLMEAGVDVFKLGGRYFHPQDIPPKVVFYRQLLDALHKKESSFCWKPWEEKVKELFAQQAQELIY